MVKTIGFDPVPDSSLRKILRFVILSWKDSVLRMFDIEGRTSRLPFIISIIPIIIIWVGLIIIPIIAPPEYKLLDNILFLILLFLPMLIGSTLIVRRLHDSGVKAISMGNPIHLLTPFSSFISAYILFREGDDMENKFGPPHTLIPKINEDIS